MTTKISYPAHVYFDDLGGWGLLFDHLDVTAEDISEAATSLGCDPTELAFHPSYLVCWPRIKRCDLRDDPGCDMAGEWHTHWAPVRPTPDPAFQYVFIARSMVSPS